MIDDVLTESVWVPSAASSKGWLPTGHTYWTRARKRSEVLSATETIFAENAEDAQLELDRRLSCEEGLTRVVRDQQDLIALEAPVLGTAEPSKIAELVKRHGKLGVSDNVRQAVIQIGLAHQVTIEAANTYGEAILIQDGIIFNADSCTIEYNPKRYKKLIRDRKYRTRLDKRDQQRYQERRKWAEVSANATQKVVKYNRQLRQLIASKLPKTKVVIVINATQGEPLQFIETVQQLFSKNKHRTVPGYMPAVRALRELPKESLCKAHRTFLAAELKYLKSKEKKRRKHG